MKLSVQDIKEKAIEVKEKTAKTAKKCWDYCCENSGKIVAGTIAIGTIAGTGLKVVKTIADIGATIQGSNSDKSYYDRSLGQEIKLRRKLSETEKKNIRRRHELTGESYYEIYEDLDLL